MRRVGAAEFGAAVTACLTRDGDIEAAADGWALLRQDGHRLLLQLG
ncbi:hypothetical protein ACIA5G_49455 [Amycolatopsis sp. NPDC051758]